MTWALSSLPIPQLICLANLSLSRITQAAPIIFVAHDLGGIVVKKVSVLALALYWFCALNPDYPPTNYQGPSPSTRKRKVPVHYPTS